MEGTKNKISGIIFLMVFFVLPSTAQKKDLAYYQCAFFESYKAGSMAPWPGLIAEMERVKSTDLAWQTEMVKAMYGLVGYQIGSKNKDLAREYVNKADNYLDRLLDDHPNNAQLHSLSGALYGYKIALAFYKAPFLGPKSIYHIEKSIELDPAEPMGYIEKGNSLLYRPAVFGGDKNQALVYYKKALKLMESRNIVKCNWQQMLLRAFILKTLYETNQTAEAKIFIDSMQKDYGSMIWIKQFVGANLMDGK
jgi:tetratricopeptide (TPR) repeat protein